MAIIEKMLTIPNVEEDVNNLNSHMVLVSLWNAIATLESSWHSPAKLNIHLPSDPATAHTAQTKYISTRKPVQESADELL